MLQTLTFNKDTSLVVSAKMSGREHSSHRTSTDSTDSRFTNVQTTLRGNSKMVFKNRQINATYDPSNPKKQDFTRFQTFGKKSGHTIKICSSFKKENLTGKSRIPAKMNLLLKLLESDKTTK